MLKHISVRNIALIRELELDFEERLAVLTGETGAGKSLIVDSLSFILGAKADKSLVSYGCDKARVEALFSVRPAIAASLAEGGYECEDGEVLLARTLTADGKSEIRINGRVVTLAVLKSFTVLMADIHGQHEHQSLLKPSSHIVFLDDFAADRLTESKRRVAEACTAVKEIQKQLRAFGGSEDERLRTIDLLTYQVGEIENAKISADEENELSKKYNIASHAEKLTENLQETMRYLNGNGDRLSDIARGAVTLASLERFDSKFEALAQRINGAYYELDDVFEEIKHYLDQNAVDPREVDRIGDRLDEYKRLKRKYGADVAQVLRFCEESKAQLSRLEHSAEQIEALNLALKQALSDYYAAAKELHELRVDAARRLTTAVLTELADLGMGSAIFETIFRDFPDRSEIDRFVTANGSDELEFFLSANKGEPAKPLAKVISGGEMSRFMLALKVIAADTDSIDTMVFDEIDTGISGKIGEAIACKLARLSRKHQVLCITHLPYIAAMADQHLRIHKEEGKEKTSTLVENLSKEGMLSEISRLVGGSEISKHSLSHSEELKSWCDRFKQSIVKEE